MSTTLNTLQPAAAVLTTILYVEDDNDEDTQESILVETIIVTNMSTATTFKIYLGPNPDCCSQDTGYMIYDTTLADNEYLFLNLNLQIQEGEYLAVESASGNVNFKVLG